MNTRISWKAVGRRLRVARLVLGITEVEAASAHEVTLRTYRRWEAGGRQRGLSFLPFATKHDVSIDWMLFGEGTGISRHLSKTLGKVAILPVSTALRRERDAGRRAFERSMT